MSWDPAAIGDAGSASLLSQVYESLTALDSQNRVQPALAQSWTIANGGTSITFQLRPGVTFSDGSPITADDVRRSWLHVLDPSRPSPLTDLLSDVVGASAFASGSGSADDVGIDADGASVTVHFRRPAAYFVSTVSSPTLAVVPPLPDDAAGPLPSAGTGGVRCVRARVGDRLGHPTDGQSALLGGLATDPEHHGGDLAGRQQPGGRVPGEHRRLHADLAGRRLVDPVRRSLGPQLRRADDLSVLYYGFTTASPPFDNVDVRRAFSMAVDWDRIVTLDDPTANPATSMIPTGIEGRGTTDYSPRFDAAGAKAALARAGYPNGSGFPTVTLVSQGGGYEQAVADELQQNLGVTVTVEEMPFDDYASRLDSGTPTFWTIDWVADYPASRGLSRPATRIGQPEQRRRME